MSRTKQTPRKTTSGKANRVRLRARKQVLVSNGELGSGENAEAPQGAVLCSLCGNGGFLHDCDRCSRAICSRCIEIPSEFVDALAADGVHFECVFCHWQNGKNPVPYVGFTRGGAPILPSFLKVTGKFELSTLARVASPSALIIDLRLATIDLLAHSLLLQNSLREYFPRGRLDVVSIAFDLGTDKSVDNWPTHVSAALANLSDVYQHVVVVITDHADEDRGDLFLGENEIGKMMSASVDEFLPTLLEPFNRYLEGAMIYFVACGSLVCNQESFGMLCGALRSLKIGHALAFDAPQLVTSITSELLTKLTRNVVVFQFDFVVALEYLLQDVTDVGKHTSIIHIGPNSATRYTWSHRDLQPWGKRISIQCDQCGTVQRWTSVARKTGGYAFQCMNDRCGWEGNRKMHNVYAFVVLPPQDVELLHKNRVAGCSWMKISLTV